MTEKLYSVKTRGLGLFFVVADDPNQAYQKVRDDLYKKDLGFNHDRELASVELIAENCEYPNCKTRLFL